MLQLIPKGTYDFDVELCGEVVGTFWLKRDANPTVDCKKGVLRCGDRTVVISNDLRLIARWLETNGVLARVVRDVVESLNKETTMKLVRFEDVNEASYHTATYEQVDPFIRRAMQQTSGDLSLTETWSDRQHTYEDVVRVLDDLTDAAEKIRPEDAAVLTDEAIGVSLAVAQAHLNCILNAAARRGLLTNIHGENVEVPRGDGTMTRAPQIRIVMARNVNVPLPVPTAPPVTEPKLASAEGEATKVRSGADFGDED